MTMGGTRVPSTKSTECPCYLQLPQPGLECTSSPLLVLHGCSQPAVVGRAAMAGARLLVLPWPGGPCAAGLGALSCCCRSPGAVVVPDRMLGKVTLLTA